MPEPESLPCQATGKLAELSVAGRPGTELTGGVESIVFDHTGVAIAGFRSKTIDAWSLTVVPLASELFAFATRDTHPSAPGGKKPASGSVGGCNVAGSREAMLQLSTPD